MALDEWDAALWEPTVQTASNSLASLRYGEVIPLHAKVASRNAAIAPAWQSVAKRGLDVTAAILLLVILSPLFLVLSVGVLLSSRGGIFFKHDRVGKDGRIFKLVKFRSMQVGTHERIWSDADAALAFMTEGFKLPGDHSAITKFGRILRLTSLDELPQLWNVLRGQMSLVGVRPLVPVEVAARPQFEQQLYRSMRPGITGLWQVNGRSSLEHEDRCALDREYVEEWSLGMDVSILLRTPLAVLRPQHTA